MKHAGCFVVALLFLLCSACAGNEDVAPDLPVETVSAEEQPPVTDLAPGQDSSPAVGAVVHEDAWIIDAPEDGWRVVKSSVQNNTGKTIESLREGMFAYDAEGMPLDIQWIGFETGEDPSHYYLCDWLDNLTIQPGETHDWDGGGWTLFHESEAAQEQYAKIEYVLYNFAQIEFEDGTVWVNPDYEDWVNSHRNKPADPQDLQSYYPYTVAVA